MEFQITKAAPEDAEALLEYLKCIGGETDNLSFGSEGFPISPEAERSYIASLCDSDTSVMYVAKCGGEIVGNASFTAMTRTRLKHRGEIAVSVKKAAWGCGIGTRLIEALLRFAKSTAHTEIVSLEVRSDNTRAIRLYRKFGFEKIGTFPGFFKINGMPIDFDLMYLKL